MEFQNLDLHRRVMREVGMGNSRANIFARMPTDFRAYLGLQQDHMDSYRVDYALLRNGRPGLDSQRRLADAASARPGPSQGGDRRERRSHGRSGDDRHQRHGSGSSRSQGSNRQRRGR